MVGQVALRLDLTAQWSLCGLVNFRHAERFRRLTLLSALGLSQRDKLYLFCRLRPNRSARPANFRMI
jgi:hypothetical protein